MWLVVGPRPRDEATGWLATAIQLSAQAGLRMGEVLALLVGDIDFDQQNLLVKRALPDAASCLATGRSEIVNSC